MWARSTFAQPRIHSHKDWGQLQAQFYATTKSLIEDKLCCVCAAVENQPTSTWKILPQLPRPKKAGKWEKPGGLSSVGIACMFASYLFGCLSFRFQLGITFLISFRFVFFLHFSVRGKTLMYVSKEYIENGLKNIKSKIPLKLLEHLLVIYCASLRALFAGAKWMANMDKKEMKNDLTRE